MELRAGRRQDAAPSDVSLHALAVSAFLNVMQRNCRWGPLANIAQTAGLITVTADGIWQEPIHWPLWMLRPLSGSVSLDARQADGTFDAPQENVWDLSIVDASVTRDLQAKVICCSLVNRARTQEAEVSLTLAAGRVEAQGEMTLLHHGDPAAMNSAVPPRNVAPQTKTIHLLRAICAWNCPRMRMQRCASPSHVTKAWRAEDLRRRPYA